MNLIKPILKRLDNFKNNEAKTISKAGIQEFATEVSKMSEGLKGEGTRLARAIVNQEGGSTGNAASLLHSATDLINRGTCHMSSGFNVAFASGDEPFSLYRNFKTLQETAKKIVRDFVDFFQTPEAVLKSKSGLPVSNVDALLKAISQSQSTPANA